MESSFVKVNLKKIKRIPKKTIIILCALTLIVVFLVIQLFRPMYHSINNLQEIDITIDKVYIIDTYDNIGSRMKLIIQSQDANYYLWYPSSHYIDFRDNVQNDLLSGNITSVKAIIAEDQSIRDIILNQIRIVHLKSDNAVYYDLDTEKVGLKQNYISLWIAFILVLIIWLGAIVLISLVYGVLTFRKSKKESKPC